MRFLNYVYVIFLQKSQNFETTYFFFFYFKIFKIRQFKNICFLIVKTKQTYKFFMLLNDVFNHFFKHSLHFINKWPCILQKVLPHSLQKVLCLLIFLSYMQNWHLFNNVSEFFASLYYTSKPSCLKELIISNCRP